MYPFDKKEQIIYYLCARIVNVSLEMVDDFINDPEVISIFYDDSWKIVSAEQRGKAEEKIETAKNMLKEKCSPKFISKITNLSISEINKLKVN